MPHPTRQEDEWVVFWASLLSPLYLEEVDTKETARFLRELASQEHLFPDGQRRKIGLSTLWRKWRQLREGGVEALRRRPRSDRGKIRGERRRMIERAIELKRDQPRRSPQVINQFLKAEFGRTIPPSTMHRHLRAAGATRAKLLGSRQPIRGRWTRDRSNALWVGDFEDGPRVLVGDQVKKTHLSVFIDCHSRYVVAGRYYLRENLDVLIDTLLRAWSEHGSSRELYIDNAKVYHAKALQLAALAVQTRLRYRKVRDPAGGGLIERFFGTAQSQFETEVRAGSILTLDKLNEGFAAWLAVGYHQAVHSEIHEAPRVRYERDRLEHRRVDMSQVVSYFYRREERTVHRDFCDVQLHGAYYRVDKKLRGDRVQVRYDPFQRPLTVVYIHDRQSGVFLGEGVLHDRPVNPHQDDLPAHLPKPQFSYIDLLIRQHRDALSRQAQGIDYQAALSRADRRWPFTDFVQRLASRLGRQGGTSAFSTEELEALSRFYERWAELSAVMVDRAVAAVPEPTITEVLYQLQLLIDEERSQ